MMQIVSWILNDNFFQFFAMPAYINFYGIQKELSENEKKDSETKKKVSEVQKEFSLLKDKKFYITLIISLNAIIKLHDFVFYFYC